MVNVKAHALQIILLIPQIQTFVLQKKIAIYGNSTDPNNPVCSKCSPGCSSCIDSKVTGCTACSSGYYLAGTECKKCNSQCSECFGKSNTECLKCTKQNFLLLGTTCDFTC